MSSLASLVVIWRHSVNPFYLHPLKRLPELPEPLPIGFAPVDRLTTHTHYE